MNTDIYIHRHFEQPPAREVPPVAPSPAAREAGAVNDFERGQTHEARQGQQTQGSTNQADDQQASETQAKPAEKLRQMVDEANEQAQQVRRKLEFSVDDVTSRIVVKVKDSQTDEVIRQIPPEEMMEIARSLSENDSNVLFKDQA